jgi:membrane-bound lytic murein transglycosylase B
LPPQRAVPGRASRRLTDRPARRSSVARPGRRHAGEIGQTQFLPSSYIKYGVDYDGNGHVDLRHSVPDVLASTANLLKTNGWRACAPFGEGTSNFEVMSQGNRSVVYRKTMVLFAERLAEP